MYVDTPKRLFQSSCENCWKNFGKCCCDLIKPSRSPFRVLILQHPQEARRPEGTARLLSLSIENSVHRVGLSWSSLKQALRADADPKRWGVLYLGSLKDSPTRTNSPKNLEGIVVLDGNWKQAKALYWRNPWLKRLAKIQISPKRGSDYTPLRRQPRKDCLSTIEAAAEFFEEHGFREGATQLRGLFSQFLDVMNAGALSGPNENSGAQLL